MFARRLRSQSCDQGGRALCQEVWNQISVVDDSLYDWVTQWKWSAKRNKGKWYAVRTVPSDASPSRSVGRNPSVGPFGLSERHERPSPVVFLRSSILGHDVTFARLPAVRISAGSGGLASPVLAIVVSPLPNPL